MRNTSITDGNFRIMRPDKAMGFTGERMTTAMEGEIEFEHFHRYCLARDFCSGLDVLDVASGEGYGSAILAKVARTVVGVDIDPGSVAHALGAYRAENLRFVQGSALDLPLDDASVDVVVSFETLEHVREHERFAAEVRRVLRAGGMFIVSTPDRAVYSARGERVNEFHLLELTQAEFEAFLRAHFEHVVLLHQRAILGSVIATHEDAGAWRSYERRALEYIEASSGLARARYLIAAASDAELPRVASSAYIDRRSAAEAAEGLVRAPVAEARAAERERERDAARAALAEAERRSGERERERDAALAEAERRAGERERERDAARAALAEAERRAGERERELIQRIDALERERDKLLQDLLRTSEDRLRQLAGLKRVDYDGQVPKSLGGLGLLVPGQAKKLRQLARNYRILAASPLFDGRWYLSVNPDVAQAKIDPALHYLLYGAREGRWPGQIFNGAEYQSANTDVLTSEINPLLHYILYGRKESRRTSVSRELFHDVRPASAPLQEPLRYGPPSYKPLVSVIVPNYNHKHFLTERIDFILHQTYTNIEIILLDDKSTDGSQELLKDYHERYPERVRLVLNNTNSGNVFLQWRNGVDQARGDLIWICESDDYSETNFLEILVPYFRDLSVNIVFGKTQFVSHDGQLKQGLDSYREQAEAGVWQETVRRPAYKWFCRGFGVNNVIANVGGSVWRRQALLDDVWSEAQTATVLGDWFLYCHLSGGGQIVYEPRAVSYFRQHGNNISVMSFKTESYYSEHQWLILTLRRYWGVPDSTVGAFIGKLLLQYNHFKADGKLRPFDQLFKSELVYRTQRRKPHILIAFYGFYIGGGSYFRYTLPTAYGARDMLFLCSPLIYHT